MSWLLLVSGSREKLYKNKGESRGPVMLSTAAKLRVVAGRDLVLREGMQELCYGEKTVYMMMQKNQSKLAHFIVKSGETIY